MYSYEIKQIVESNNNYVDSELYCKITSSSPQINHIKYDPYNNEYEIWTNDDYYWKITVYRKE